MTILATYLWCVRMLLLQLRRMNVQYTFRVLYTTHGFGVFLVHWYWWQGNTLAENKKNWQHDLLKRNQAKHKQVHIFYVDILNLTIPIDDTEGTCGKEHHRSSLCDCVRVVSALMALGGWHTFLSPGRYDHVMKASPDTRNLSQRPPARLIQWGRGRRHFWMFFF